MSNDLIKKYKKDCVLIDESINIDDFSKRIVFTFYNMPIGDCYQDIQKKNQKTLLNNIIKNIFIRLLEDYGDNLSDVTDQTFDDKIKELMYKDFIVCSCNARNWPGIENKTLEAIFKEKCDQTPKIDENTEMGTVPFIDVNFKFRFNFDYVIKNFIPSDFQIECFIDELWTGDEYKYNNVSYDRKGILDLFKKYIFFYYVTCRYEVIAEKGDLIYDYPYPLSRYSERLLNLFKRSFDANIIYNGPFEKIKISSSESFHYSLDEIKKNNKVKQDFIDILSLDKKEILLSYYFYGSNLERKKEEDFYSFVEQAKERMEGKDFVEFADQTFIEKMFNTSFITKVMMGLYYAGNIALLNSLLEYLKTKNEIYKTYYDETVKLIEEEQVWRKNRMA